MKKVLILQIFGLGDCLWAQGIAHSFMSQGYTVIWPVKDDYYAGLIKAYPYIHWVPASIVKPELFDIKEKKEVDGILIAPIRWSDSYMKLPYKDVMIAKYLMYDLDWKMWLKSAYPKRDLDKELDLADRLGVKYNEPYNLVATKFGSGTIREIPIATNNSYRNVQMDFIPGYSIFDWIGIIQHAETIHAVSSASLYLFELIDLRAKEVHLYARKPIEQNLNFVKPILSKKYILHE